MTAACPACRAGSTQVLWTASANEAAQAFVRAESDPSRHAALTEHIHRLWGGERCSVMRCVQCGLGFSHPFVGGDATFYNLAYPGTPGYPDNKWEFQLTLQDLQRQPAARLQQARCLEVGAGIGNFLKRLVPLGCPAAKVLALEYNQESLRVLGERGFQGRAQDLRELQDGPYDFIFMFQVVEHMADLDSVFSRVAALLAPGGALYVAMPNPQRIDYNERNGTLMDMPPNHISRWTQAGLDTLVSRHGLAIRRFETEGGRWVAFAKQDLKYYTLRQSMKPGTLASRVYESEQSPRRKALLALTAVAYLLRRVPLWLRTGTGYRQLGGSVWAVIEPRRPAA
jgi:SAM-dependent methyltransferase